ncbi:MAG: hypothetical protein GY756_13460 [bacterium]|nr:hypothetical protein [bacterium]
MKQKLVYVLLGVLICISCVTMMATNLTGQGNAASITTSDDGKYVYIMGVGTDDFYRSEDFGKTFENFGIDQK